jgi:phosphoribosylanthranilate isomerase
VATGVENGDFNKDPALMKAFVEAVRRHEREED